MFIINHTCIKTDITFSCYCCTVTAGWNRTNKYCIWYFVLFGKFSRLLRAWIN